MKSVVRNFSNSIEENTTSFFCFENLALKAVPLLLGIYVFVNPFPHNTTTQTITFWLAVLFAAWLFISKKEEFVAFPPLSLPLLIYIGWASLSIVWSLDRENTLHDLRAHLAEGILLFYLIVNIFKTSKRLISLLWIIAISTVIFSIWKLIYYYFYLDYDIQIKLVTGQAQLPVNWIAYVTIFSFAILHMFLELQKRMWQKCLTGLAMTPLLLITIATQSRATIMATTLCAIFLLWKRWKFFWGILILMLFVILFTPVKGRFNNLIAMPAKEARVSVYLTTLKVIMDHPLVGFGYGHGIYHDKIDLPAYNAQLPEKFRRETSSIIRDPHNLILDVTAKLGLIGLGVFSWILFSFFKLCADLQKHSESEIIKKSAKTLMAGGMAFILISLFEPAYGYVAETLFFIILAMAAALYRIETNPDCHVPPKN